MLFRGGVPFDGTLFYYMISHTFLVVKQVDFLPIADIIYSLYEYSLCE